MYANRRNFRVLTEIGVEKHDDVRFFIESGNTAVSCMRNASGHNFYRICHKNMTDAVETPKNVVGSLKYSLSLRVVESYGDVRTISFCTCAVQIWSKSSADSVNIAS